MCPILYKHHLNGCHRGLTSNVFSWINQRNSSARYGEQFEWVLFYINFWHMYSLKLNKLSFVRFPTWKNVKNDAFIPLKCYFIPLKCYFINLKMILLYQNDTFYIKMLLYQVFGRITFDSNFKRNSHLQFQ